MVSELFATAADVESRCAVNGVGDIKKAWWWGERLRARYAVLEAGEVGVPGRMHRVGVVTPPPVHLFCVVRIGARCECVVG